MLGRPWFDPGRPDIGKHKVDPDNSGSGGQQREEHRYSDVSEQRYWDAGLSPGMGRVTAHPRFDAVDHSVAWE